MRGGGLLPLDRVDEVPVALGADVQVVGRARSRGGAPAPGSERLEVHDLDRPARREDDAADVMAVVGGLAHGVTPRSAVRRGT